MALPPRPRPPLPPPAPVLDPATSLGVPGLAASPSPASCPAPGGHRGTRGGGVGGSHGQLGGPELTQGPRGFWGHPWVQGASGWVGGTCGSWGLPWGMCTGPGGLLWVLGVSVCLWSTPRSLRHPWAPDTSGFIGGTHVSQGYVYVGSGDTCGCQGQICWVLGALWVCWWHLQVLVTSVGPGGHLDLLVAPMDPRDIYGA